jgi:hypothetical protein
MPNESQDDKLLRLYVITSGIILGCLCVALPILATYVFFPSILASLHSPLIHLMGALFLLVVIVAGFFSIIVSKRISKR